jgi:hypothetical protein
VAALALAILMLAPCTPATASFRSGPTWWDPGTVGSAPDWHYRISVSIPTGTAIGTKIKLDFDTATQLAKLGVSGTLDVNSIRVVRSTAVQAAQQSFDDATYGGTTDSTGNGRGEIRFVTEDAGAATYQVYFDITANGTKTAITQSSITGSFGSATLGTPTAFGIYWSTPNGTDTRTIGYALPMLVKVDASPLSVTASVYDETGTLKASGIQLYNDGTHGDATANDASWTNTGAYSDSPTYTIPLGTTPANWMVRAFGKDGSTSTIGASNGLIRINGSTGTAETRTNFLNVDETYFRVNGARVVTSLIQTIVSDPVNGTSGNQKIIPGTRVRYCRALSNTQGATAENLALTVNLSSKWTYITGTLRSGANCVVINTVEDEDAVGSDDSDGMGLSYSSSVVAFTVSTLAPSASAAMQFEAIIN